jgi:hypothetical protein
MRRDSLEGEAREGVALRMSAVTGGVPGTGSKRVQALGRGPSVAKVRAGRIFVEEARLRIGGGERELIMNESEEGRTKTVGGSDGVGWWCCKYMRIAWCA